MRTKMAPVRRYSYSIGGYLYRIVCVFLSNPYVVQGQQTINVLLLVYLTAMQQKKSYVALNN